MAFKNPFARKPMPKKPIQRPTTPKKKGCKIKFKKTESGEVMTFEGDCSPAMIQRAEELRAKRREGMEE